MLLGSTFIVLHTSATSSVWLDIRFFLNVQAYPSWQKLQHVPMPRPYFQRMFPMFYPCYNLVPPFWKAININCSSLVGRLSPNHVKNALILLWYLCGMWILMGFSQHSGGVYKRDQTPGWWNLCSLQETGMEFHLCPHFHSVIPTPSARRL